MKKQAKIKDCVVKPVHICHPHEDQWDVDQVNYVRQLGQDGKNVAREKCVD